MKGSKLSSAAEQPVGSAHPATDYQALFQGLPQAAVLLDSSWMVTAWNRNAEKLFPVLLGASTRPTLWEILPASAGSNAKAVLRQAMETRTAQLLEHPYQGLLLSIHAVPCENGLTVYFQDRAEQPSSGHRLPEHALSDNEDYLRLLLDSAAEGFYAVDNQGVTTKCNKAFLRMLGFARAEDAIGRKLHNVIHHSHRDGTHYPVTDCPIYQAARTGKSSHVENELFFRLDGTGFPVEYRAYPILRDGEIKGAITTFVDITERKRTESDRHRFISLAENSSDFIGMCDLDGNPFYINPAALEMVGLQSLEQAQQTHISKFFFPEEQAFIADEFIPRVLREGHAEVEIRFRHFQTGTPLWMLFSLFTLNDEFGKVIGLATASRNVTERKRAEAAERAASERLHFMAESMPQMIFTARPDGEVDYFNAQWLKFTGLTFAQIKDWGWRQVVYPDDVEENVRAWQDSLATGEPFQIEHRLRRADGSYRWHLSRAQAMVDPNGKIAMWIGSNTDIHDQKLAEDTLRKTEKLAVVGRLASTIAHEINNPLEAVTNLLYLMETENLPGSFRTYLEMAQSELARVSHVVTHTLQFHRQSTLPTSENISALIDSAIAVYQGRLKNSGIEVSRDYRDLEPVQCFASELRQVFSNVIGNAFDASRAGGKIVLRTRNVKDHRTGRHGVRVTIADTGLGMSPNTRKHLFEPFFTTKGLNGTGLGLWVSADILKKHRATIQVKSREGAGHSGTVFSMFFPRNSTQDAALPKALHETA